MSSLTRPMIFSLLVLPMTAMADLPTQIDSSREDPYSFERRLSPQSTLSYEITWNEHWDLNIGSFSDSIRSTQTGTLIQEVQRVRSGESATVGFSVRFSEETQEGRRVSDVEGCCTLSERLRPHPLLSRMSEARFLGEFGEGAKIVDRNGGLTFAPATVRETPAVPDGAETYWPFLLNLSQMEFPLEAVTPNEAWLQTFPLEEQVYLPGDRIEELTDGMHFARDIGSVTVRFTPTGVALNEGEEVVVLSLSADGSSQITFMDVDSYQDRPNAEDALFSTHLRGEGWALYSPSQKRIVELSLDLGTVGYPNANDTNDATLSGVRSFHMR